MDFASQPRGVVGTEKPANLCAANHVGMTGYAETSKSMFVVTP